MGVASQAGDRRPTSPLPVKLDQRIWVDTPEQIRFQYQTVGGLTRAMALVIDLFLMAALLASLTLVAGLLSLLVLWLFASNSAGSQVVDFLFGLGTGFYLIALFVLWWFYGVIQEYVFHGRTWGKMLLQIRVLGLDGRTPTLAQCVWRNFLRLADGLPFFPIIFLIPVDDFSLIGNGQQSRTIIEVASARSTFFPTFGVAILAMMLTARNQRLGDLFAGTMVVETESYGTPLVPVYQDPELLALADRLPRGFHANRDLVDTLSLYVSRRTRFTLERRREIARHLAAVLAAEFGFTESIDPDLLLGAVYLRAVCDPNKLSALYEASLSQGASWSGSPR